MGLEKEDLNIKISKRVTRVEKWKREFRREITPSYAHCVLWCVCVCVCARARARVRVYVCIKARFPPCIVVSSCLPAGFAVVS